MEEITRLSSLWLGLAERLRSKWGGARPAKAESWVWYIEARRFNRVKGQPGAVPEDDPVRGSGVAVRLEHLERITDPEGDHWAPKNPPEIRKYLLTCAHVVRGFQPSGEWNALLGEFLCWGPKSRYLHWQAGNHRRLSGQADAIGAHLAKFKYAPIATQDAVPSEDATPTNDWVLLEVDDGPSGKFDQMPAVETWRDIGRDERDLSVIGYPGGALSWSSNQEVIPHRSTGFGVKRVGPGGPSLTGPDETRPGMSGGGVFDSGEALVAIHRAVTDRAMERHSVPIAQIRQWLEERGLRPAPSPAHQELRFAGGIWQALWTPTTLGLLLFGFLSAASLWWWLIRSPVSESFCLVAKGAEDPPGAEGSVLLKPLAGLELRMVPEGWQLPKTVSATTDLEGQACFDLDLPPELGRRASLLFHIRCANAPGPLEQLSPLILDPHGITTDGLKQSSADLVRIRGRDGEKGRLGGVSVYSERKWKAAFLSGSITESANVLEEVINAQIVRVSAERELTPAQIDSSIDAWASVLMAERPVIPTSELSVPDADAIRRVAAAVGAFYQDGKWLGTAFVISPTAVLVRGHSLPEDDHERWITFGEERDGGAPHVALGRILWRRNVPGYNIGTSIYLVEAKGNLPSPPALGRTQSGNIESGREVYVIGYPDPDFRTPPELQAIFTRARRTAMFGETLAFDYNRQYEIVHDAVTTNGTAGAPLVDRESNAVIGIHFGGTFKGRIHKENTATSLGILLADQGFRDAAFGSAIDPEIIELAPQVGPTDPLQLGSDSPLVAGYDPFFLGAPIPLPMVVNGGALRLVDSPLDYVHHSVVMSTQGRTARLAAANLDRESLVRLPREPDRWLLDPRLSADSQPSEALFLNNPLDRGHLIARRALMWGSPDVAKLASLSVLYWPNATPQHSNLNRGTWMELERRVYEELHPESQRLSVFAGPVEDPMDVLYRGFRVPRRFWLVAAYENKKNSWAPTVHAFFAEQYPLGASGDLDEWPKLEGGATEVTIADIEREARIKFRFPMKTNSASGVTQ